MATTGSLLQEAWMSVSPTLIPPRFGLYLGRALIHGPSQGEKRTRMSFDQIRQGTGMSAVRCPA